MPTEALAMTRFVSVDFTNIDWNDAVASVVQAAGAQQFTTVVTPNVDHIVRMDRLGSAPLGQRYRAALADADFCFCDSRILGRLARFRGVTLPVVPGSDLTATLFRDHLAGELPIAVVGGDSATLPDIKRYNPRLATTQHIPPMGMINDPVAMDAAAQFICDFGQGYIFVAVGSPQGEILVHRARQLGATRGVALSIGASIDFITGRQARAPKVFQKLGLEWAHRLLTQPKRLWRRYLVDGPRIFAIVMRADSR
jgi:N-acetylglucosaminyldiphosphoundecaprenol N-acetyl-beta-D-mannosaminyltransferase